MKNSLTYCIFGAGRPQIFQAQLLQLTSQTTTLRPGLPFPLPLALPLYVRFVVSGIFFPLN